jgi:fused signal recognition particle receptor
MFGFFKRKTPVAPPATEPVVSPVAPLAAPVEAQIEAATEAPIALAPTPERRSWYAKLKQGLSKTSSNIATLFVGTRIDENLYEELEAALLMADTGVEACNLLLTQLKARVKEGKLSEPPQVRQALQDLIKEALLPLERGLDIEKAAPLVWMIAGVNGAGKTTSIGKLAHLLQLENKSVLLAAGDTFRAAAREQLAVWGQRNNVQVIAQEGGDPAAVAFDAVSAAKARAIHVVMIDTAGRLPTQTHLMDELKKIRRVIAKAQADAPHECLLVLDGNTGQNMLAQVKAFDDAIGLTGLIVTKLDGTAKGGAILALANARKAAPIPVYFIGVGETMHDLEAFSASEFAAALVSQ